MKGLMLPALLLLASCGGSIENRSEEAPRYFFDLKEYFEKEAARLSSEKTSVLKEVVRNDTRETRELNINWKQELALFTESDINKPAWKDSYRKVDSGDVISYIATDDDLRTRKIILRKGANGELKHIQINNRTSNFLYSSTEKLNYYPNKGYTIEKSQEVRVIGKNHYLIKTTLK